MATRKGSKSTGKKVRFIFGRDMSEDEMVKAIRKMCDEAGVEFVPSKNGSKIHSRKLRKAKK